MPRRVSRQAVPDGPIRAFFDGLHRQHLLAGEPSTRELARETAYSHTTIHKAMRGPRVPRWGLVELLVEALGGHRDQFHELWVAARDEEDRLDAGSSSDLPPDGATSTATLTRPTPPRDAEVDRSGDVPPPSPGPLAPVTLPEGIRALLGRLGRELAQRAWRQEWERGFRDALQFARECELPWSVLEGLAGAGFDIPKWIAGWRNGWADVALGRAREGALVAPWLPKAAHYLGSLADPIGYDEFSFTPTALYVRGFGDGLRAVWSAAGGEATTVPTSDEDEPET
jgi:hypothetical protein